MITNYKIFENLDDYSIWKEGDEVYSIYNGYHFGEKLKIINVDRNRKERITFLRFEDDPLYYAVIGTLDGKPRFTKDPRKITQMRFDL